jgi:hypothetical protein
MTDAGYVIAGWTLTGVVIGAYWLRLRVRTRRAERLEHEG